VTDRPVLVVDAANVVGSVPDGWWRDRAGATARLRDALAPVAEHGLADWRAEPLDVVLVVEGRARSVPGSDAVRVLAAAGSGDDAIVEFVRELPADTPRAVVTADRELRRRVTEFNADLLGPHTVRTY
jgi:hypothetical protein